jgi:hypothetical protein
LFIPKAGLSSSHSARTVETQGANSIRGDVGKPSKDASQAKSVPYDSDSAKRRAGQASGLMPSRESIASRIDRWVDQTRHDGEEKRAAASLVKSKPLLNFGTGKYTRKASIPATSPRRVRQSDASVTIPKSSKQEIIVALIPLQEPNPGMYFLVSDKKRPYTFYAKALDAKFNG